MKSMTMIAQAMGASGGCVYACALTVNLAAATEISISLLPKPSDFGTHTLGNLLWKADALHECMLARFDGTLNGSIGIAAEGRRQLSLTGRTV